MSNRRPARSQNLPQEQLNELLRLEREIRRDEDARLHARWEFGHILLVIRGNRKQLPKGVLQAWADEHQVHRSEISARMKFAERYPTPTDFSNAVRQFPTWSQITKHGLTVEKRPRIQAANPLAQIAKRLEALDPADFTDSDVTRLREAVDRWLITQATLARKEAA